MRRAFRYSFPESIPLDHVEESLVMSIIAAESIHGAAEARLAVGHLLDRAGRCCVIDGSTETGCDLNKVFVGLLMKQFGAAGFDVRRVEGYSQLEPPEFGDS